MYAPMKPVTLHLGFPSLEYEPYLDTARQTRVTEICLSLEKIDGALLDAALDSMAVELGDTVVNYSQHTLMLKSEGDRLLRELSALARLPILFNRFTGENNRGQAIVNGLPNPYPPQSISASMMSPYSVYSPY